MDSLKLRLATASDVAAIVSLLSDDPLGAKREKPGDPAYDKAFEAIDRDPNNELWVIEGPDGRVRGILQLTFIPGLSHTAGWRAQIEGVRVADELTGKGVGTWFFKQMIERAREKGVRLVQLTSDKTRADAIRFYEALGFTATHEGFKLKFD
ncbi:MAG: GNAT family N-acetyltransferase [Rhodospirillales bacterium]|nr:GNAT family N-acetyltransferase [Rhodospirillales bacterium]MBO6785442.1 GNAT family N-acetyltransferase [Rhodospirillales bacterium]